jgi:hypothetical protein
VKRRSSQPGRHAAARASSKRKKAWNVPLRALSSILRNTNMSGRRKGLNEIWFIDRVREALKAADEGDNAAAIDLLESLADHCHETARNTLTEWHELQALWMLGVELEKHNRHARAAAAYCRVADSRRAALQEAGHGLASALAAAAIASLRAGKRMAARKLAKEALGLHNVYPLPRHDLEFLRREMRLEDPSHGTRHLRRTTSNQGRRPTNRARKSKPKSNS